MLTIVHALLSDPEASYQDLGASTITITDTQEPASLMRRRSLPHPQLTSNFRTSDLSRRQTHSVSTVSSQQPAAPEPI
jgi:hypothetical protein